MQRRILLKVPVIDAFTLHEIWKKHPPIFVFLLAGKSFGVTTKSVVSHKTKLTENLRKKIGEKVGRYILSVAVDFFGRSVIVWCDICLKPGSHTRIVKDYRSKTGKDQEILSDSG